jgi:hypothetical protein
VACWGILFDLLQHCSLLAQHVAEEKVVFGINHEMRDFKVGRKKNLDLVLCTPGTPPAKKPKYVSFRARVDDWGIDLTASERKLLLSLPDIAQGPVGAVHVALEAKANMTEHIKALPRFYDELNSSHLTIHGSTDMAIAVGFTMVNIAPTFRSPKREEITVHKQPDAAIRTVEKIKELSRRTKTGDTGFDAIGIAVVDCRNDGVTPVRLVTAPPAPVPGDIFHYDQMIRRVAQLYESRFPRI